MSTEWRFKAYSALHLLAKKLLLRPTLDVTPVSVRNSKRSYCDNIQEASILWDKFIANSEVNDASEFSGFLHAGYILEQSQWCLSSWIWTNAAIVRMLSSTHRIDEAKVLCDKLILKQTAEGGWIVRNDFDAKGAKPMLAPNDSAYIANNACLSIYGVTGDDAYLIPAIKCARWIMATCREDGLVHTGYNLRDKKWETDNVIVDIGFTAALFANLYKYTSDKIYLQFLDRFIKRYIELFFMSDRNGFATSINSVNSTQGGMFSRGQAWALEGLIPAYKTLHDDRIKYVIEHTISNLLSKQNRDGSWAYNMMRPLMGNDCKGVSTIAKALLDWNDINENPKLKSAADKALDWCIKHTVKTGPAHGGIFSYCVEGAVVKSLYSSCAFVYSSSYALEVYNKLYGK